MTFEEIFKIDQQGFKITVKATDVAHGEFDVKLSAEQGGEVVAIDFIFGVIDSERNLKKSTMKRLAEDDIVHLLTEFANKLLDKAESQSGAPAVSSGIPEEMQMGDQLEFPS